MTRRARAARRPADGGMTLTELMVVVVIIGVLAAAARPMFNRERVKQEARDYASMMAREFQRARFEAITQRAVQRAFVFSDRVEFRNAVPLADPNDPPRPAELADPITRILRAPRGVSTWAVNNTGVQPGSGTLSTATSATLHWNTVGQGQIVGVAGQTIISLFVRNANPQAGVAERNFRINIAPLTGHVELVEAW